MLRKWIDSCCILSIMSCSVRKRREKGRNRETCREHAVGTGDGQKWGELLHFSPLCKAVSHCLYSWVCS